MDSGKWFAIAIGYECVFAWVIGLFINQFYNLLVLGQFGIWTVVAIVLLVAMLFQIFRPMPKFAWTDETRPTLLLLPSLPNLASR